MYASIFNKILLQDVFFLDLGTSACSYYGRGTQECKLKEVTVQILPSECTSFVFDGLSTNLKNEIYGTNQMDIESTELKSYKSINNPIEYCIEYLNNIYKSF